MFQVNRIEYSKAMVTSRKNNRRFGFPLTLDLTPFVVASSPAQCRPDSRLGSGSSVKASELAYSLQAIIVHSGHASRGHFRTFIKIEREWFCFDDSRVARWEQDDVLALSMGKKPGHATSNAYCLFYSESTDRAAITRKRVSGSKRKKSGASCPNTPKRPRSRCQQSRIRLRPRLRPTCLRTSSRPKCTTGTCACWKMLRPGNERGKSRSQI